MKRNKVILIIVVFVGLFVLSSLTGYNAYRRISGNAAVKIGGIIEDMSYKYVINDAKSYLKEKYKAEFVFTGLGKNESEDMLEYYYSASNNPRLRITVLKNNNVFQDNLPEVLKWNSKSSRFGIGVIEVTPDNYVELSKQIVKCLNSYRCGCYNGRCNRTWLHYSAYIQGNKYGNSRS